MNNSEFLGIIRSLLQDDINSIRTLAMFGHETPMEEYLEHAFSLLENDDLRLVFFLYVLTMSRKQLKRNLSIRIKTLLSWSPKYALNSLSILTGKQEVEERIQEISKQKDYVAKYVELARVKTNAWGVMQYGLDEKIRELKELYKGLGELEEQLLAIDVREN